MSELSHDQSTMPALSTDGLAQAILRTLAYADLFDYPMTAEEIHNYLIACPASRPQVESALADHSRLDGQVSRRAGYLTMAQRERLVELRSLRNSHSAALWRKAMRYGSILASVPFVRMVAVTGALAVSNVRERDDIDFLIVTAPGHLWTVRGAAVALVRMARVRGDQLCPNYLVTTERLYIAEQNLYTAHEVAQMVPLYGFQIYQEYWQRNGWLTKFLPNARAQQSFREIELEASVRFLKSHLERLLGTGLGERLELWEQQRKIAKLRERVTSVADQTNFTPDCCKGHFEGHAHRALSEFDRRWGQLKV